MSIRNPIIPGETLAGFDRKIEDLEKMLAHLESKEGKPRSMYIGSTSALLWDSFKEQTVSRLQDLRDEKRKHLSENPPPPREKLKCPHCDYDGEFDVKEGETKGIGFRILKPILEPRWIVDYDGEKLTMSDPCERYDPFDMIAEPGFVECLDFDPGKDEVESEIRQMLKGRWVFCCGNDECLKYFDARPFIYKAHLEYGGYDHPNKDRWGKR